MPDQPEMDPRSLRDAFGALPTGVSVVTLRDEAGKATGVTVGSFTSLSLSPSLCLFSLGRNQASVRLFNQDTAFVVNVLPEHMAEVAWQFAKPLEDKCAGVALSDTTGDVPGLQGAIARFACQTEAIHDGGDHIIVVGRVMAFDHAPGDALVFYRGGMHRPVPVSAESMETKST